MDRSYYLNLAASGLRMPIGTDLVLHEQPDAGEIMLDGARLGEVIAMSARRWNTPLAVPLMDLRLEKADLLAMLDVPPEQVDTYHLTAPPADETMDRVASSRYAAFGRRNQAHIDSIRYVRERTDLFPVGMAIGPFSLMTKLLADPITPIALAGKGLTAEDDPSIALAGRALILAELAVARSLAAQTDAGARAVLICEPAASVVYLSPKQIGSGSGIFEHYVMQPNLRLKQQLTESGADLFFHDCGELTDSMVEQFAHRLHPAILSLGGSRRLWEDAARVPPDVTLFGNLPTKSFYSDTVMPDAKVEEMTRELIANMQSAGHPHILGSECDVLHVAESAQTIRRKVDLMLRCAR